MSDTEYCYPPEFTVLKNKAGLRDADQLEQFERLHTLSRLLDCPLDTPVSYEGYKEIHRQIFQDVYDWAGQPRRIDIHKGDYFCRAPFIDQEMRRQFQALRDENELKGLEASRFAGRAAVYLGEINAVHPFREGNGRTQRVFLRNLAHQAGHAIDLTRIQREDWLEASIRSFRAQDYEPMEQIIRQAMGGREQNLSDRRRESLERMKRTAPARSPRERER
ncbi:MAG: Fic family protein [Chromatiales bacterium]|nr:Fic family protein [Chromatiales bacterium]